MIKKKMLFFFIIYGLIGAIAVLTQYIGIVLGVPVAIVSFLLYSQPIWTVFFGKILLKEHITSRKILSVAIPVIGLLCLLKPWDIKSAGPLEGIISALIAGIFISLWVIWGRKSGLNKQHYITTTFGFAAFSLAWLLLLWPVLNYFIKDQSIVRLSLGFPSHYWIYFALFALISGVIPHSLFYKGVKHIHASVAGILLLLEPVSATVLAAIIFSQSIGLNVILGGVLIILSNYFVTKK